MKHFKFIQALILDPVLEVLITQTTHLSVDIWLHSVYYFSSWSFQYQFPYTFYSSFLFIIFDVRLIWNETTSSDIEILAWICDNDHGFLSFCSFRTSHTSSALLEKVLFKNNMIFLIKNRKRNSVFRLALTHRRSSALELLYHDIRREDSNNKKM